MAVVEKSKMWIVWIIIAALIVAGIILGIFLYMRSGKTKDEKDQTAGGSSGSSGRHSAGARRAATYRTIVGQRQA